MLDSILLNKITSELHESTSDNVVMVGYGAKKTNGVYTDELGLVFGVLEKKLIQELAPEDIIPKEIEREGYKFITDVIEFEIPNLVQVCPPPFYNWITTPPGNRGLIRPIQGGVSTTNVTSMSNSVGTLGFVAVDNDTNSVCAVTNAHVIIDDPFIDSDRTLPNPITNVVNDLVIQPGWENSSFVGTQNAVGIVKKYLPLRENSPNYVDTAIFTLNESDVSNTTSYRQFGMTGWTSPMDFATTSELNSITPFQKYFFSSGRTTGAKGEGDMKLIPSLKNAVITVFGYSNQGVGKLVNFHGVTEFVASASTTPTNNICQYPIYGGDSGSAVAAEFSGDRKIVGQAFAASTYYAYYVPIDAIVSALNISPYTGQTSCWSDTGNTQIHLVVGRSNQNTITIGGNTYWQAGLVDCPTVSSTPTPTPTITNTPAPSPDPGVSPTPTPTITVTPSPSGIPEDCCRSFIIDVDAFECTGVTLSYIDCADNLQTEQFAPNTLTTICARPNSITIVPSSLSCDFQIISQEDCDCIIPITQTPTPTVTITQTPSSTLTPTPTPSTTPDFTPTQTPTTTVTPSATPPCCSTYNLYSMSPVTYTIVNCDGSVDVVSYGPFYAFTVCALSVTPLEGYIFPECECCLIVSGTSITANVLDTPNANSYSRGSVSVGYWNGSSLVNPTGAATKSTGNTLVVVGGDLGDDDNCQRGAIEVTAFVPSSIAGSTGYRTQITITKNGFPIGTVTSGPNPTGSNVTQTFDFARSNNDVINVQYNSIL